MDRRRASGVNFEFSSAVLEPSTWVMILAFARIGFMAYHRSRKSTRLLQPDQTCLRHTETVLGQSLVWTLGARTVRPGPAHLTASE
jgi:hypothetical protein